MLDHVDFLTLAISHLDTACVFVLDGGLFALANHEGQDAANNGIIAALALVMGARIGIAIMHGAHDETQGCRFYGLIIFLLDAGKVCLELSAQLRRVG